MVADGVVDGVLSVESGVRKASLGFGISFRALKKPVGGKENFCRFPKKFYCQR
jgi:hypothetical protein